MLGFHRFRVKDKSMLPRFREGDKVMTRPFFRLRGGDVVVALAGNRHVIKRIERLEDGVWLRGDAPASKRYGPLHKKNIVGKVWMHAKT